VRLPVTGARPPVFTCCRCGDQADGIDGILNHVRLIHPDAYGDGPERWPDGGLVIYDDTTPDLDMI
jgi:hypothetical protein